MTEDVTGLPLAEALELLAQAGITAPAITQSRAPRGMTPRGTLRVTRVRNGGRELVVSEFSDTLDTQRPNTQDEDNAIE